MLRKAVLVLMFMVACSLCISVNAPNAAAEVPSLSIELGSPVSGGVDGDYNGY